MGKQAFRTAARGAAEFRPQPMIKTIFFDLGLTIIPFDFKRGYAAMAGLCGLPAEEIARRVDATKLFVRFELGQIEPRDFVRQVCGLLGCELGYEEFCELWGVIFLPETLIPASLLENLARNYRLFSLSNTNALHFPLLLRDYPLLGHFHGHVLSYEVGAMKPDPRIYEAAIARAGCPAQECLFIDDLQTNVDGARRAGMDAIHFQSAGQLSSELSLRGIGNGVA
jgi:glucose-1-phosphatase